MQFIDFREKYAFLVKSHRSLSEAIRFQFVTMYFLLSHLNMENSNLKYEILFISIQTKATNPLACVASSQEAVAMTPYALKYQGLSAYYWYNLIHMGNKTHNK